MSIRVTIGIFSKEQGQAMVLATIMSYGIDEGVLAHHGLAMAFATTIMVRQIRIATPMSF